MSVFSVFAPSLFTYLSITCTFLIVCYVKIFMMTLVARIAIERFEDIFCLGIQHDIQSSSQALSPFMGYLRSCIAGWLDMGDIVKIDLKKFCSVLGKFIKDFCGDCL